MNGQGEKGEKVPKRGQRRFNKSGGGTCFGANRRASKYTNIFIGDKRHVYRHDFYEATANDHKSTPTTTAASVASNSLVGWSLTSLFSTNMAISETKASKNRQPYKRGK